MTTPTHARGKMKDELLDFVRELPLAVRLELLKVPDIAFHMWSRCQGVWYHVASCNNTLLWGTAVQEGRVVLLPASPIAIIDYTVTLYPEGTDYALSGPATNRYLEFTHTKDGDDLSHWVEQHCDDPTGYKAACRMLTRTLGLL